MKFHSVLIFGATVLGKKDLKFVKWQRLIVDLIVFSGFSVAPDIKRIIEEFTEKTRSGFRCGFESMMIPSLDPFILSEYSSSLASVGNLQESEFLTNFSKSQL